MKKIIKFLTVLGVVSFMLGVIVNVVKEKINSRDKREVKHHFYGPYEKYFKRPFDFTVALLALIFLSPVLMTVALLVKVKLGSPIIFFQERPGKNERLFKLHKFRTMTDERDADGRLLSDDKRLTGFGRKLRSSSLDELPEIIDILAGNLSIVGPRPQLVKDIVFMNENHRKRHEVMPGLTGLAQVNGRNDIDWEQKLEFDLEYVNEITFWGDFKIILKTIIKVLKQEGITETGMATATDYGDYLLEHGKVSHKEYINNQEKARRILKQG